MTKPATIRVTRAYDFSSERVFDAWLDPHRAGKFLFTTPDGEMVKVEIDARVGGKFCFVDRREGKDIEHIGEYIEIVRPHRLVFEFAVPVYSAERSRVIIEITARGNGCELVLTADGVPEEWRERTEQGWVTILGGLDELLGHSTS